MRTTNGLRITLIAAAVLFLFISHVLFVVLVLLFLLSVFRPNWLLPGIKVEEKVEKPGEKDDDEKAAGDEDKEKETDKKG